MLANATTLTALTRAIQQTQDAVSQLWVLLGELKKEAETIGNPAPQMALSTIIDGEQQNPSRSEQNPETEQRKRDRPAYELMHCVAVIVHLEKEYKETSGISAPDIARHLHLYSLRSPKNNADAENLWRYLSLGVATEYLANPQNGSTYIATSKGRKRLQEWLSRGAIRPS